MARLRQITPYLDIDLDRETWCCHECGQELISARENYKKGCLVCDRDPKEVYRPIIEGGRFSFSPSSDWCHIVEFYCPNCGVMVENEILPPGHPITHDIQPDIEALKKKGPSQVAAKA